MGSIADIPTEELMAELRRRVECADKPEKRVILVGAGARALPRARARSPRPTERALVALAQMCIGWAGEGGRVHARCVGVCVWACVLACVCRSACLYPPNRACVRARVCISALARRALTANRPHASPAPGRAAGRRPTRLRQGLAVAGHQGGALPVPPRHRRHAARGRQGGHRAREEGQGERRAIVHACGCGSSHESAHVRVRAGVRACADAHARVRANARTCAIGRRAALPLTDRPGRGTNAPPHAGRHGLGRACVGRPGGWHHRGCRQGA